MSHPRLAVPPAPELDFEAIRNELEIPGAFGPDVVAAAEAAASAPKLPTDDATGIELVTIDPPGSMDLDQALAVEARGEGWRVHYAIADVAAFVEPGGPLDLATRERTQTYYAPDRRQPLHPPVLGEAAASLLPDGDRPAALWTIDVASDGTTTSADVRRAMVRSRARLSYREVQDALAAGSAPSSLTALADLGPALLADAERRGAIELGIPEQEVIPGPGGHWTVALRAELAVERWNAQVSLLTGRAAAKMMLDAGVGLLRTLPAPDQDQIPRLRTAARGLGITWPEGGTPGAVLSGLNMALPRHAAFADLATELLRGAGYTPFEGAAPADPGHGGVGSPYAHVTAPLRRLIDRFTAEICLAVCAGRAVPGWVTDAFDTLPSTMKEGDSRGHRLERAVVDATEAFVLNGRVGDLFTAAVMETGDKWGTVVLDEPAVRARCDDPELPLGDQIQVRCTQADIAARQVRFARVR